MSEENQKRKPTTKAQEVQTYVQVETGIYRYKDKDGEISYHERPWIISKAGKPARTYRSLGFNFTAQSNLASAREEYHRRRTEVAAGRDPYASQSPKQEPAKPTVSQIVQTYVAANYPDRYLKPKTGRTLDGEKSDCETLLGYWNGQPWDSLLPKDWDDYHTHRLIQINGREKVDAWKIANDVVQNGGQAEVPALRGDRAIDLERNTLLNAFKYAIRKGLISSNPVKNFARFKPLADVKHCREFKPESADELHQVASLLFTLGREELAWQLLLEAYTGLRTIEVLMLRVDAKTPGEPGYVDPEGNLHVIRVKRGINPFVHLNEGLQVLLDAHRTWHAIRHPDNPYFIPGRQAGKPMKLKTLAHALRHLRSKIGRKLTSHGLRAWYVLIRRSWGIADAVIAVELGQGSGAGLIATTYGDVPANWRNGGGPRLSWLPTKAPAWADLQQNGWATKPLKVAA